MTTPVVLSPIRRAAGLAVIHTMIWLTRRITEKAFMHEIEDECRLDRAILRHRRSRILTRDARDCHDRWVGHLEQFRKETAS